MKCSPVNSRIRARMIGQTLVLGIPQKLLRVQDTRIVRVVPLQMLRELPLDCGSLSFIEWLWVAIALPFCVLLAFWLFGLASLPMLLAWGVGFALGVGVLVGLVTVFSTIQFWRDLIESQLGWATFQLEPDHIGFESHNHQIILPSNLWHIQRQPEQVVIVLHHQIITITARPEELDWFVSTLKSAQQLGEL